MDLIGLRSVDVRKANTLWLVEMTSVLMKRTTLDVSCTLRILKKPLIMWERQTLDLR